ncbi:MAG TPA: diguanylate cyclase [Pseudomonas sp.]|jgi:diguanylate cyclase (GGDEF)-like protein/PAS domain S-box-containing protein
METNTYAALVGFVDMLMDAICVVDSQGRYVYVSAACERMFGYTPAELIGQQMLELVHPDDREGTLAAAREIMAGQPKLHFENRYIHKNGHVVHVMWSARWSEVDRLRIAVARDITELKRSEALRLALFAISEAAHKAVDLVGLFRQMHEIIGTLLPAQNFSVALFDPQREQLNFPYHADEQDPLRQSPVALTLALEIAETGTAVLFCGSKKASLSQSLIGLIDDTSACWLGVPLNAQSGTIGALMIKGHCGDGHYNEQDQELLQFIANQATAAIERQRMHERLQHMAQFDALTHLPNRMLLHERLLGSLEFARLSEGRLAVLYLDLDKFKVVNDTFGHAVGDQLLQEVARRLTQCVRESDTVARIGGDEFIVLLDRINKNDDAHIVASKILATLNEPISLGGIHWTIMPSIGVAHFPEDGADPAQLFKYADEAMYQAKKNGGNRFQG